MIFIITGSQKFQFNRLLQKVDDLIEQGSITEDIFAQTGYSDYKPHSYKYANFLDRVEFQNMIEKSDIVISHGGTGAIVGALKKGKKVIAVPRLEKYGEHVDNHQLQLLQQFDDLKLILPCKNLDELSIAIDKIRTMNFNTYVSNTEQIMNEIEKFIASI